MDVFIARQPIFDRKNKVYAYELLYRNHEKNYFDGSVTSNVATSLLLMNSYFNFGIDNLTGGHKAFINFDKYLIEGDIPKLLNKDQAVIEILEDVKPDRKFINKIKQLKNEGYTLALDDYVMSYPYQDLVDLADIIKVDFFENTQQEIAGIAKEMKARGKILLAEKVETKEIHDWSLDLGYDFFQGYYFAKPRMMKTKGMADSTMQYIRIMKELTVKEPDYRKIAHIIETDPTMTYKLLRLVNSNFVGEREIKSIQHGLSILGIESFEKWVSLAMVQDLGEGKPSELLRISLIRAKFLELLAGKIQLKEKDAEMMLLGIMSVLDAMLEKPMADVLKDLPVSDQVKAALLFEASPYLDAYQLVLKYEQGTIDPDCKEFKNLTIKCKEVPDLYYQAIKWAEDMFEVMKIE